MLLVHTCTTVNLNCLIEEALLLMYFLKNLRSLPQCTTSSLLYRGTWAFLLSVGTPWPGHPDETTGPCLSVASWEKYLAGLPLFHDTGQNFYNEHRKVCVKTVHDTGASELYNNLRSPNVRENIWPLPQNCDQLGVSRWLWGIYLTAAPKLRTTWGQLADSAYMICCLTWPAAWTLSGRLIWRYWSLFQSPTNIMISLLMPISAMYMAPRLCRLWVEYAVGSLPMAVTMFFLVGFGIEGMLVGPNPY